MNGAAMRKPARKTPKRAIASWLLLSPLAFGLVLTLAIVAVSATAASAQSFFDPTSAIQGQATGWVSQAADWAKRIYFSLLVFELIALAVTALLFRDNLGEFFAGASLKVFVGGIYFWFINNAGTDPNSWTHHVIGTFRFIGLRLAGMSDTTPEGPSPFVWLGTEGIFAATAYIGAGILMQIHLAALATAGGFFSTVAGISILDGGHFFEMAVQGMGVMILMGMGAIYLQLVLITVESYIVMGAGILFIGFAGSRFTLPFSQGYFSYMINVGVKYLVVYLILGIEQPLMHAILVNATGAFLTSLIPGYGLVAVIIVAAFGLINVLIAAALIWMIPGLVGSLLSGQSSASGSAVLSQAIGAMAGAAQAIAQLQKGHHNDAKAREYDNDFKHHGDKPLAAAPGTNSGHVATGGGQTGGNVQSSTGTPNPNGAGSSSSGFEPGTGKDQLEERAQDAREDALLNRAFAMSALAQAAPRDIGQPSAVQVRLSNPDKL